MSVFEIDDVFGDNFCVYGHYIGDECIYVGLGSIGRAFFKFRKHWNMEWYERAKDTPVKVVIFYRTNDRKEAFKLEAAMIKVLKPSCNTNQTEGKTMRVVTRDEPYKMDNRPVKCLETGAIFKSSLEADRAMGFKLGTVCANVRKRTKSAKGFQFIRVDWSEAGLPEPYRKRNYRKMAQPALQS